MRKYTDVYRGEDEPKVKDVLWVHHSKYNDLQSGIIAEVYSKGKWVPLGSGKGYNDLHDIILDRISAAIADQVIRERELNTPLTFEAKTDGTVIRFCAYNPEEMQRDIEVSFDEGETWLPFKSYSYDDAQSIIAVLDTGEKILVRGNNPSIGYYSEDEGAAIEGGGFYIVGEAYAYGNVMSLLDSTDFASMTSVPGYAFACLFCDSSMREGWDNGSSLFSHPTKRLLLPATTLADKCYWEMFNHCASLTIAPELPATTLAENCYGNMFSNCPSLMAVPKLSATTLAKNCYIGMFQNCTSLTAATELPATTLAPYCYSGMFYGCTAITVAPKLPTTTLAEECYQFMFEGCTSLTTTPELPATTLADGCYRNMFKNCTSLTVASELPATILASDCYLGMFKGCKSLTIAPKLCATILADSCYYEMFNDCTSLKIAPELPATTLAEGCYQRMFYNCRNLTITSELPATILTKRCYAYMFYNCKSLTSASKIPATMLAESCCSNMFSDCTSLTTAPELPATTLANNCYYMMFNDCTNLNYIKALFTTTPSNTYTRDWVKGVSSTGTFVKNSAATWNITGDNGIPTGWTVETASA